MSRPQCSHSARYLDAVRSFADVVMQRARDRFSPEGSPLLADGLEVATRTPVVWPHPEGHSMVMSNLANQQALLRTLDGLSALTGEAKYRECALGAVRFMFAQFQDESGLLHWGGHRMVDLMTHQTFGLENYHELRGHYPYYDLMFAADPAGAKRFIEAFWDAHILNWSNLDMSRHGRFGPAAPRTIPLWRDHFAHTNVFFTGRGLSAINIGSDLFYAAALLSRHSADAQPLHWSRRMALRFVETRDVKTGLGAYQFSEVDWAERAADQLGPALATKARESRILDRERATGRFAIASLCQLNLAQVLAAPPVRQEGHVCDAKLVEEQARLANTFLRWTREDLVAFARYGYHPEDNTFRAMLTDGTPLSPSDLKKPGYYAADTLLPFPATGLFLWTYAQAHRLTNDPFLWEIARDMAAGNGLGDIGAAPRESPALRPDPPAADPNLIFGLLELYRATEREDFLESACAVADNILAEHYQDGLFVDSPYLQYTRLGRAEPLALLHLAAALEGGEAAIPAHLPGEMYFTAPARHKKRASDYLSIYTKLRSRPEI